MSVVTDNKLNDVKCVIDVSYIVLCFYIFIFLVNGCIHKACAFGINLKCRLQQIITGKQVSDNN